MTYGALDVKMVSKNIKGCVFLIQALDIANIL